MTVKRTFTCASCAVRIPLTCLPDQLDMGTLPKLKFYCQPCHAKLEPGKVT